MLLAAPADRDALLAELARYFGVDARLLRPMADATLQRAWRVTQLHESWAAGTTGVGAADSSPG